MCIHTFVYMRLYWRVKINGKWTWRPAIDLGKDENGFTIVMEFNPNAIDLNLALEEEE